MSWKDSFINYFVFNKRDINGTIVLVVILMAVILFSRFYNGVPPHSQKADSLLIHSILELDSLSVAEQNDSNDDKNYTDESSVKEHRLKPFVFNPNDLPAEKWIEMGFSEKQVKVIKNYESKAGRFRTKEDVARIFVISDREYEQIKDFIVIPPGQEQRRNYETRISTQKVINISWADTLEMAQLKGIGSSFARRIVNYRNSLGGFYKKEQLLEVWGLDSSKYNLIKNFVTVDSSMILKININTVDFKTLNAHPYIDYNLAKSIFNYRKKLGNFRKIEDLKQVPLMYNELFLKLKPYICIQ